MGVFKERSMEHQEKRLQELRRLYRCYVLEPAHDDSLYLPNFEKELGPLRCHEKSLIGLKDLIRLLR